MSRVLVVDDQESVRRVLRTMIVSQTAFQLCGEASDGLQALQMAVDLNPQVILMDISMPGLNGLEATRRIIKALPEAEVLIISQYESPQAIRAAQEAGARGYLPKCHAGKHLISALNTVSNHQPFFPSFPPG